MLNTMIVLKMKNCTYDDWEKAFDADAEMQAEFMRETIVGKVDEQTAIVSADVFAPEKMQQLMSAPEFKQLEEEISMLKTSVNDDRKGSTISSMSKEL
ncbi:MAG: hypothetical protein VXW13_10815, partial [SAR324 cluster bacterium]|nr:hypothetical protein [SAR324 cluster bacterium]